MMMSFLTVYIIVFAVLSSSILADNPCRYEHPTKGVIDLSSVGRTDGSAAYKDISVPGTNYKYSYNPCKSFSEGSICIDVAVCQVSNDGKLTFVLGKQDSASWSPGAGLGAGPSVTYEYNDKKVTVSLACGDDSTREFEALGENPTNNYKFKLTHECACWDGCKGPSPGTTTGAPKAGSGGIGGGAVFIIILLVLAFVYFVGFALFYRFSQQRSGTDLIAHRTFWVALPAYAKDGAVYAYRRVTGKAEAPYSSV